MSSRYGALFICVFSVALTSCGKDSTGPLPVASVQVSAPSTTVIVGETLQLSAKALDASGSVMPDRLISWTSSDTTRATVTQGGLVTSRAKGSVRITATSEARSAFVDLNIAPVPVTITAISPSTLVAGQNATITGTGFSAIPSEDSVTFAGAPATLVSATSTALTVVVPATSECLPTRSVDVQVKVEDRTATKAVLLRSSYSMQLAVGQSEIVADPARLACTEFPSADAKFVIAVVNVRDTISADLSYRITGKSGVAAALQAFDIGGAEQGSGMRRSTGFDQVRSARAAVTGNASVVAGEKRTFFVPGFNGTPVCTLNPMATADSWPRQITARAVYVGERAIVWADDNGYSAGQADAALIQLGQKMDSYYPALSGSFGDPLSTDSVTDHDGHFGVVVSPAVRPVTDGGYMQTYHNGGYINPCDFKPYEPPVNNVPPAYGGNYSNFGEYVYSNSPSPYSAAHTLQHLIEAELAFLNPPPSRPARVSDGALAEGMAELNEEYYGRTIEHPVAWKSNSSLTCCSTPYAGLDELARNDRHRLDGTNLVHVSAFTWSFMRWYVDQFAFTEQATLRALTQQRGVNLSRLAELVVLPKEHLLGNWALALYTDGLPQFSGNSAVNIATWNLRGLFDASGSTYPLNPDNLTFGDFVVEGVLMSTGFKHFMLTTTAGQSHLFMMSQAGGTSALPADIKLAIARVQ